jgi:hypothetical protein
VPSSVTSPKRDNFTRHPAQWRKLRRHICAVVVCERYVCWRKQLVGALPPPFIIGSCIIIREFTPRLRNGDQQHCLLLEHNPIRKKPTSRMNFLYFWWAFALLSLRGALSTSHSVPYSHHHPAQIHIYLLPLRDVAAFFIKCGDARFTIFLRRLFLNYNPGD